MRAAPAPAAAPPAPRWAALGSALLLTGSVALAGEVAIQPVYPPGVLARLLVLAGLVLGGLALGGARCRPPVWAIVVGALLAVRALAVAPPLDSVIADDRLRTGVLVLAGVTAVPALLPLVRVAHTGQVAAVALAVAAAGHALVLLTVPGVWLGDARWAGLVALIAAGALLAWQVWTRGGSRLGLAVLVVVLPGTVHLVQQPGTGTLLLPMLVAAAVLADRGRTGWAAVAFGVALATQQQVVLLVPLLLRCGFRARHLATAAGTAVVLTLPWLLANPARFVDGTVGLFLGGAATPTTRSLWLHVPASLRLPLLVAALLAGYLLAWWYCPRGGSGFLIGAAVVGTTFGLTASQTFLNQWWLVAALVTAGLALAARPGRRFYAGPGETG